MRPDPLPATNDSAFTYRGLSVYLWASSARQTMAAAEPSATPAQSMTDSWPATAAILQIASTSISRRYMARGLRAPLWWFFDAIRATVRRSSSLSTPYFSAYAGNTRLNIAAAVRVRFVPSLGIGNALRPWNPESFTFSTPRAIAVS